MRRILVETLELPRWAIRPTSPLAALIPPQNRQRIQSLFRQQGLNAFDLSFSRSQSVIAWSVPAVVLLLGVAMAITVDVWALACIAFVGSMIAGIITYEVLSNRATEMCATLTVKDAVVRAMRVHHYLKAGYEFSSREELFLKVCEIIGRNLGVDPTRLTEKTNFQEDIGAD
jgi:hypothetical protein